MKMIEAHSDTVKKNLPFSEMSEEDFSAFRERMSVRFRKVWALNHGEDNENSSEKQTYRQEEYIRS